MLPLKRKVKDIFYTVLGVTIAFVIYSWNDLNDLLDKYLEKRRAEFVYNIYLDIVKQTGQSTKLPSISVSNQMVVNAYATQNEIVMYRGMLEYVSYNKDVIAAILGHEASHVLLDHVGGGEVFKCFGDEESSYNYEGDTGDIILDVQRKEALADQLGAFYMMKAGYNICEARKFWKFLQQQYGDYIGEDHPDYAYRYDQLNVRCE